ncbi:MAG: hypothetical protein ABJA83_11040 [Burkholderiaceae bacterium]
MFTWTFNALTGFRPAAPRTPLATVQKRSDAMTPSQESAVTAGTLENRRAEALRRLFPKISSWLASQRHSLMIDEVNHYLSQASNVTDLEQRIRVIEQRRHFS